MKKMSIVIACVILVMLLSGNAMAEPNYSESDQSSAESGNQIMPPDTFEEQAEAMDTDDMVGALPNESREILGDISITDADMGDGALKAIYNYIKENLLGVFKEALKSAVKILTVVILCSVISSSLSEGSVKDMVDLGGTIAISAIAISNVNSFIGLGMETLYKLSDFSKALLPVMCTAAVSAGAITSASAKFAVTAMFMDVLITVATNIILPLISVYLASVIANAVLSKDSLAKVSKLLKWVCTTALTVLILAFTSSLGIKGLISGKADEFATKLTKTALGSVLPVVGSMLSDTAETLVVGAGMIRNAIGVFGFLAVITVCLAPVLTLAAHYFVYKGTSALTDALGDKRFSSVISDIGTAFGMLLGLVGTGGIILFISLLSSMKAVNAL